MSGSAEVLQEYLVSVGFQADAISSRKFEESLTGVTKKVVSTGFKVAAVVAGVEAATAAFAYNMRKVYFAAELSGTTVKNLQSLEFAGKQIGISAEQMGSAVHSMATALRLNPGKMALLDSLTGLREEGKDTTQQLLDLVKATEKFPEYIGAQYAAQFGIDSDTYHQMRDHLGELIAKQKEMLDIYRQMGVDPDKAKKTTLEYATAMDELKMRTEVLAQALLIRFEPAFKSSTNLIKESLDYWTAWANGTQKVTDTLQQLPLVGKVFQTTDDAKGANFIAKGKWWDASFVMPAGDYLSALKMKAEGKSDAEIAKHFRSMAQHPQASSWDKLRQTEERGGAPTPEGKSDAEIAKHFRSMAQHPQASSWDKLRQTEERGGAPTPEVMAAQAARAKKEAYLHSLEAVYGLPHGLLDTTWARESQRGKLLNSPAGAQGPFQFMPSTSKEYGLKDPYSFHDSAFAAARKYRHLLGMYGGDVSKAAAAYNWGEGNLNKDIRLHGDNWLAYAPHETQGYVDYFRRHLGTSGAGGAGVQLAQHTEIKVMTTGSPTEVGRAVAGQQNRVNGDLVRNLKGHLS